MKFPYCVLGCLAAVSYAVSIQASPLPQEAIKALEDKFSFVPGKRRNHTRGQCFSGSFTATAEAKKFTKSSIFNGKQVKVIGRFSHAGGNAMARDNHSKVFGMALRFDSDSEGHSMAMLNLPFFDVATPEGFVAKIKALTPQAGESSPDSDMVSKFHKLHPESLRLKSFLKHKNRTPKGWGYQAFNSIHSFIVTSADGTERAIRWSFEPELGEYWYQGRAPDEFLVDQLVAQLATQEIHYRMRVFSPNASDDINDPSKPWQGKGLAIDFGRLTISKSSGECEGVNFDPLHLSAGFMPSMDSVLRFRSPAYAVSFAKRLAERSSKAE